jgi:hypothetical protein
VRLRIGSTEAERLLLAVEGWSDMWRRDLIVRRFSEF